MSGKVPTKRVVVYFMLENKRNPVYKLFKYYTHLANRPLTTVCPRCFFSAPFQEAQKCAWYSNPLFTQLTSQI